MALDLTPPILLLLDVKIHAKEQPDRQAPEVRRCHGPRNGAEAPDPDQRIPSPRPQFRAVPGPGRSSLGPPDGLHGTAGERERSFPPTLRIRPGRLRG